MVDNKSVKPIKTLVNSGLVEPTSDIAVSPINSKEVVSFDVETSVDMNVDVNVESLLSSNARSIMNLKGYQVQNKSSVSIDFDYDDINVLNVSLLKKFIDVNGQITPLNLSSSPKKTRKDDIKKYKKIVQSIKYARFLSLIPYV